MNDDIRQKIEDFRAKRKIRLLVSILLVLLVVIGGALYFFWHTDVFVKLRSPQNGKQVDIAISTATKGMSKVSAEESTIDSDGDGLVDKVEQLIGTDPGQMDTDNDGIIDGEEIYGWRTDPRFADSDGDGLSDYNEAKVYRTNPLEKDSDGDGFMDGEEVNSGHDPKGEGKLE